MKLVKISSRISTNLLSRRQALKLGTRAIATLAMLLLAKFQVLSYLIYPFTDVALAKTKINRTFRVSGKSSLKKRAKAKGLMYGAFPQVGSDVFDRDPKWKSIFVRECATLVAGCYWDQTRPSSTTFDFQEVDRIVKFAASNRMLVRGHPLVWHLATANWMKDTINKQNATQILTDHIQTVVKRYVGKIQSWDVVNEAIDVKDGRSDGLKNISWLEFLGPDYIDLSFQIAARVDPKALLIYNEQNLEYDEVHQRATLKLLQQLKSKGTPVHALGIQSHLRGHRQDFNPIKFRKFLRKVANLGLKILITELDVVDQELPIDVSNRDRTIAATYEDYLNVVLSEKAVIGVTSWGLSDRYTWLNEYLPRPDRSPSRPLPFDRDMQPKLAWNAIARAFDRAPKR
ncbi:endo-1,4-beta-xylanase [Chamaesiphon sp. VAR_69_metabat_338]|uniref:endo-1,4-beta-xylanase n=1 Tax=Chamaesiphon sp. VAR_69_metabat_338 TaxID=2964704 RepID=UPI00286E8FBC|nr:endo-1,4-beta-xylanase [Chamaesiphon sp. VAR_69_metabat_338]